MKNLTLFLKNTILLYFLFIGFLNTNAQCTVNGQPNIAVQAEAFSSISIIEGTTTSLTSPLAGTSYQWTLNGVPIAGATTSSLTITDFKNTDVGDYAVTVDGSALANTVILDILNTSISDLDRDRMALIDLYTSTNGSLWTRNTNWLTGDISTWEGVTVSNCRVTSLKLNRNNMVGTIPSSFKNLTALKFVNLGVNNLSGVVDVSDMPLLTHLYVQDNEITDVTFGANDLLQRIYLFRNPFTPGKTIDVSAMRQLIDFRAPKLRLDEVIISGNYPNLRYLNISDNGISGTLDISKMPKLINCNAHDNDFTNFKLGTNTDLQRFYFYNNPIPAGRSMDISSMRNLLDFRIQGLGLSNLIVSGIYDKMLYLLIQDNQLSGTLDISNMPNINLCYAHNNQFTDFNFGVHSELRRLYFYNNPVIPGRVMDISSMRKLLDFRVQGLGLSDLIISGTYDDMLYFIIQNNQIGGTLDLSNMPKIQLCYAKNNNYENFALPATVSDPDPALNHFNISGNKLHFDDLELHNSLFSTINFHYNPQQNVPTQISGNTLSVSVGGGVSYRWSPTGTNTASIMATATGTYSCEIRNPAVPGLVINSDPVYVVVSSASASKNSFTDVPSLLHGFKVGANPVRSGNPIDVYVSSYKQKIIYFNLHTVQGKQLKRFKKNVEKGSSKLALDSDGLGAGMYVLSFEIGGKLQTSKIVIE